MYRSQQEFEAAAFSRLTEYNATHARAKDATARDALIAACTIGLQRMVAADTTFTNYDYEISAIAPRLADLFGAPTPRR